MNNKNVKNLDLSHIKYAISGGDILPKSLEDRVNEYLVNHNSKARITQGYGLTEALAAVCLAHDEINKSGADILFVCLGAPKQELWMAEHKDKIKVRLMLGLGGSLDSYAGTVKRAPKIFIKLGLEWFYRLIKEPWRIGRMMALPKYMFAVIFDSFRKKDKRK